MTLDWTTCTCGKRSYRDRKDAATIRRRHHPPQPRPTRPQPPGAPVTDDLYLTRPQIQQLSTKLRGLSTWMLHDLDDVICRRTRYNDKQTGSNSFERPVEFHVKASDCAQDVQGVLRAWVWTVTTQRGLTWPGEQRTHLHAAWLDRHLIDLALCEDAGEALDEITDAWKRVNRFIDRPMVPEFIGPCQSDNDARCEGLYCRRGQDVFDCHTCGVTVDVPAVRAAVEEDMRGRLFTKGELRTALVMYAKQTVSRHMVDGWIRRGRLVDRGGKYSLDQALILLAERKSS